MCLNITNFFEECVHMCAWENEEGFTGSNIIISVSKVLDFYYIAEQRDEEKKVYKE